MKIHRCKVHPYAHNYTVCPTCQAQYCPQYWPTCPRSWWHPAHGSTPADIGARYALLGAGRTESRRRLQQFHSGKKRTGEHDG